MALRIYRREYSMVRPNRFGRGRKGSIRFHSRSLRSLLYTFLVVIACFSDESGFGSTLLLLIKNRIGNASLALVPLSVSACLETATTHRHRTPCCRAIFRGVIECPATRIVTASLQSCPSAVYHGCHYTIEHSTHSSIDTRTAWREMGLPILVELNEEADASSEMVEHLGCMCIQFSSIVGKQESTESFPQVLYSSEIFVSHGLFLVQKAVVSKPGT